MHGSLHLLTVIKEEPVYFHSKCVKPIEKNDYSLHICISVIFMAYLHTINSHLAPKSQVVNLDYLKVLFCLLIITLKHTFLDI